MSPDLVVGKRWELSAWCLTLIFAAANRKALGQSGRAATAALPGLECGLRGARAGYRSFNTTLLEDPN